MTLKKALFAALTLLAFAVWTVFVYHVGDTPNSVDASNAHARVLDTCDLFNKSQEDLASFNPYENASDVAAAVTVQLAVLGAQSDNETLGSDTNDLAMMYASPQHYPANYDELIEAVRNDCGADQLGLGSSPTPSG